jgi:hypothetical protein
MQATLNIIAEHRHAYYHFCLVSLTVIVKYKTFMLCVIMLSAVVMT